MGLHWSGLDCFGEFGTQDPEAVTQQLLLARIMRVECRAADIGFASYILHGQRIKTLAQDQSHQGVVESPSCARSAAIDRSCHAELLLLPD